MVFLREKLPLYGNGAWEGGSPWCLSGLSSAAASVYISRKAWETLEERQWRLRVDTAAPFSAVSVKQLKPTGPFPAVLQSANS